MSRALVDDGDERTLIELIASTSSQLQPVSSDLETLYERLMVPSDGSYHREKVIEHLSRSIASLLSADASGLRWTSLRDIKLHSLVRLVFENQPLLPTFQVLEYICEATRHLENVLPIGSGPAWRAAVQLGHECVAVDLEQAPLLARRIQRSYGRSINVARAALVLQKAGAQVSIRGGRVEVPEGDLRKLGDEIAQGVGRLGGLQVAHHIFSSLKFDADQERYHVAANVTCSATLRSPTVPFGYLLQVAARVALDTRPIELSDGMLQEIWSRVLELSSALAAVYDCERYSVNDSFSSTRSSFAHFVQQFAVWDSAFSLFQLRPSDLGRFLRGAFDWVDDRTFKECTGFSLSGAIVVAERIMSVAGSTRGPVVIRAEQLSCGLPKGCLAELSPILALFTHPVGSTNTGYALPTDASKQTFARRPLLRTGRSTRVLMDASWCAPAFYEAIADKVRSIVRQADDAIGLAAERLVTTKLRERGIETFRGKYRDPEGKTWECDAIVPTTDSLVLFEVKKKALTRAALSGDDLEILTDLSLSLAAAQVQLGRHELYLRQHGTLELLDDKGSISARIDLRGRSVERVAVSLLDYGTLQDPFVMEAFLATVCGVRFSTSDAKGQKKLDKLREQARELFRQHRRLSGLDPRREKRPFGSCSFISVPLLFILLDGVQSADILWKRLRTLRQLTTARHDPYADLSFLLAAERAEA